MLSIITKIVNGIKGLRQARYNPYLITGMQILKSLIKKGNLFWLIANQHISIAELLKLSMTQLYTISADGVPQLFFSNILTMNQFISIDERKLSLLYNPELSKLILNKHISIDCINSISDETLLVLQSDCIPKLVNGGRTSIQELENLPKNSQLFSILYFVDQNQNIFELIEKGTISVEQLFNLPRSSVLFDTIDQEVCKLVEEGLINIEQLCELRDSAFQKLNSSAAIRKLLESGCITPTQYAELNNDSLYVISDNERFIYKLLINHILKIGDIDPYDIMDLAIRLENFKNYYHLLCNGVVDMMRVKDKLTSLDLSHVNFVEYINRIYNNDNTLTEIDLGGSTDDKDVLDLLSALISNPEVLQRINTIIVQSVRISIAMRMTLPNLPALLDKEHLSIETYRVFPPHDTVTKENIDEYYKLIANIAYKLEPSTSYMKTAAFALSKLPSDLKFIFTTILPPPEIKCLYAAKDKFQSAVIKWHHDGLIDITEQDTLNSNSINCLNRTAEEVSLFYKNILSGKPFINMSNAQKAANEKADASLDTRNFKLINLSKKNDLIWQHQSVSYIPPTLKDYTRPDASFHKMQIHTYRPNIGF